MANGFANLAIDSRMDASFSSLSALPRSIREDILLDTRGLFQICIS